MSPNDPLTPNASSDEDGVPAEIAQLVGAKAFDIAKTRIEDFQAVAHRSAGTRLTFQFGKPAGMATGVALITKRAAQLHARLVVRRLGKRTAFALPTLEFTTQPELQAFVELIHLVPVVDVTNSQPAAYLWAHRVTAWEGYQCIQSGLERVDDTKQGLYLKYHRGGAGDPGGYSVDFFDLEAAHREIYAGVLWPEPKAVLALVPRVAFATLLDENFNLRHIWTQTR